MGLRDFLVVIFLWNSSCSSFFCSLWKNICFLVADFNLMRDGRSSFKELSFCWLSTIYIMSLSWLFFVSYLVFNYIYYINNLKYCIPLCLYYTQIAVGLYRFASQSVETKAKWDSMIRITDSADIKVCCFYCKKLSKKHMLYSLYPQSLGLLPTTVEIITKNEKVDVILL